MLSKEDLHKFGKQELVDFTYNLLLQVEKLINEVQELRDELKVYKNHKNSGNSSLPPSKDLFKLKNQSLREKSDKKSGGQPGHKGETLRMTANPDTIIKHVPGQKCPGCGEIHPEESFQLVGKRQVIDTPVIKAKVTEHQLYKSTCKCGYVSDSLSAQLKTLAKAHQLCLAHLLRDLTYFQEIYLISWPTQMKDLLLKAIRLKNAMSMEQYTEPFWERYQ